MPAGWLAAAVFGGVTVSAVLAPVVVVSASAPASERVAFVVTVPTPGYVASPLPLWPVDPPPAAPDTWNDPIPLWTVPPLPLPGEGVRRPLLGSRDPSQPVD